MSTTLTRVYQFQQEGIVGIQTIGTIDDLTTLAPSGSVIFVDILSFAIAAAGGSSTFTEFCEFNRRQLTISVVGGALVIDKSETIYNPNNTSGSTSITWNDFISGSDLVFETDSVGINQSVYITATVTIQQ